MNRRDFLAASCLAGITPLAVSAANAADKKKNRDKSPKRARRDYYELRKYTFESEAQRKRFETFLGKAAIPALNKTRIKPVGVFYPTEGHDFAYVLIPHKNKNTVLSLLEKLVEDQDFLTSGQDVIDTPSTSPAYKRVESSLFVAFQGHPIVKVPTRKKSRIFQLRIYESHSVAACQKKIEMFNEGGEIAIFQKTGLDPVFFGEALYGEKMPNLTYMLGFDNMDASKAAWKTFVSSPEWKALKAIPEYADKAILCGITNIYLKPAPCSQI